MTFTIIEVVALFFIAINLFIILLAVGWYLHQFFKYKARIKIEQECLVNNELFQVVVSFCDYAQRKGEKQIELSRLTKMLPPTVVQKLKSPTSLGSKIRLRSIAEQEPPQRGGTNEVKL